MAIIGTFTTDKSGEFNGAIQTLTLDAVTVIKPVKKIGENGPDYRVYTAGGEIGAAWSKVSQDNVPYLSLKLDDPSFPAPIFCALLEGKRGEHQLVWDRK